MLRPEGRTAAEVVAHHLTLALARSTAERDRARGIAVALEGQVAAVRAWVDELAHYDGAVLDHQRYSEGFYAGLAYAAAHLRVALDPDPADRGELAEQGRRLAIEREDLVAQGVDPNDLIVPLYLDSEPYGGARGELDLCTAEEGCTSSVHVSRCPEDHS